MGKVSIKNSLIENLRIIVNTGIIIAIVVPLCYTVAIVKGVLEGSIVGYLIPAIILEITDVFVTVLAKKAYGMNITNRNSGLKWFIRGYWFIVLAAMMTVFSIYTANADEFAIIPYFGIVAVMSFVPFWSHLECFVYNILHTAWGLILLYKLELLEENAWLLAITFVGSVAISRVLFLSKAELISLRSKLNNIRLESIEDPLTGLLNRRGFDQKLKTVWPFFIRNRCKVALMIIDIDDFKAYNDTFGHPAGDECLKQVAAEVKKTAKRSIDITARFGGEEFIVFVQGNRDEELVAFAEKLRMNIEALKIKHSPSIKRPYVTVSLGMAISWAPEADFEKMYNTADKELYRAKKSGRNAVSFMGVVRKIGTKLA